MRYVRTMQAAAAGSYVQTLAVSRETGDATATTIVGTTQTNRTAVSTASFIRISYDFVLLDQELISCR